jgi:hypothetical protein
MKTAVFVDAAGVRYLYSDGRLLGELVQLRARHDIFEVMVCRSFNSKVLVQVLRSSHSRDTGKCGADVCETPNINQPSQDVGWHHLSTWFYK